MNINWAFPFLWVFACLVFEELKRNVKVKEVWFVCWKKKMESKGKASFLFLIKDSSSFIRYMNKVAFFRYLSCLRYLIMIIHLISNFTVFISKVSPFNNGVPEIKRSSGVLEAKAPQSTPKKSRLDSRSSCPPFKVNIDYSIYIINSLHSTVNWISKMYQFFY